MTEERRYGRTETRNVHVFDCTAGISTDWVSVSSVIRVTRETRTKKGLMEETAYFISSLPATTSAHVFQKGIRGHWQIENALHYVKDVTLKEDASRIRIRQAPENMSLLRNIVLNIFRAHNYQNMAQAVRLVANDVGLLWNMILA